VPHIVERLGEVKEGRRSQCAFLKAFHNLIDYSMRLLYMRNGQVESQTGNQE